MSQQKLFIGISCSNDMSPNPFLEMVLHSTVFTSTDVDWVPTENYHLTLAYIGDISEKEGFILTNSLLSHSFTNRSPISVPLEG